MVVKSKKETDKTKDKGSLFISVASSKCVRLYKHNRLMWILLAHKMKCYHESNKEQFVQCYVVSALPVYAYKLVTFLQ